MLHSLTVAINFVALMMALWLGLYLVTRSPRRPDTWLSALALWSMGGYFLNQLLALYPPPPPSTDIKEWLYHLILFWPHNVFELGWQGWLQGWLPTYSIFFWFHATLYMLPGSFSRKRLVGAMAGYAIALFAILVKALYRTEWISPAGDPLYSSSLSGPLFPLFSIGFVVFAGLSVFNLLRTARSTPATMPQESLRLFIYATLLGGATGLLGIVSVLLNIPVPQALAALFLSTALLLTGIGVARYNALLDRKPWQRDFLYSAVEAAAVLLIYMLFHWIVTGLYELPAITFVFIGCLALITHLLIDTARLKLDLLFSQNKKRQLRLRQRQLFNSIGNRTNREVLESALETLTQDTDTTWAMVLRFTPLGLELIAAWNWTGAWLEETVSSLEISDMCADELVVLPPQHLPPPFDQAALMVPLYQQVQAGVLLVGPTRSRAGYSNAELEMIQEAGYVIAGLLVESDSKREALQQFEEVPLLAAREQATQYAEIPPRLVELGLRNLYDYAYLASSPLTELCLFRSYLGSLEYGTITHIDRGKAVSAMLIEAVIKLRPSHDDPPRPPTRDWHPYIILRDAYLDDRPNREIMSRLYISEGTFNRTRRSAIQSVTRILQEMEARSG